MSDNEDVEFDRLVQDAERELGISVGDDRPLDSTPEPPAAPPTNRLQRKLTAAVSEPEIQDNADYPVWFGTNREPLLKRGDFVGFSSKRSDTVYYGKCRVFVPRSHKIGSTGSPWWKRIATGDDRLKLLAADTSKEDSFWQSITERLALFDDNKRNAIVFIHGYNVSFENAALRAAQIGFDLSVKTSMAFFSWPSQGKYLGYTADEEAVQASEKAIEEFLVNFVLKSGASTVHLIAHSMGNRGLLRALNAIVSKTEQRTKKRFGHIFLAAPDVDTTVFTNNCRAYIAAADRVTLYVSQRDRAVRLSRWIHSFARVGFAPPIYITDGIDTINVTNVDLTMLGHGYIAETRAVLDDMFRLISTGLPPDQRGLQTRRTAGGSPYWEFRG